MRSLLARLAGLLAATALLVLAFAFLAVALAAGAALVAALLARVWWVRRRMMRQAEQAVLAARYRVIERERLPAAGDGPQQEA